VTVSRHGRPHSSSRGESSQTYADEQHRENTAGAGKDAVHQSILQQPSRCEEERSDGTLFNCILPGLKIFLGIRELYSGRSRPIAGKICCVIPCNFYMVKRNGMLFHHLTTFDLFEKISKK
jgi:hypothetical protein